MKKNNPIYTILLVLIVLAVSYMIASKVTDSTKEVSFTTFTKHVKEKDFKKINIDEMKITGETKDKKIYQTYASSDLELNWLNTKYLYQQQDNKVLKITNEPPYEKPWYLQILPTFALMCALFVFWGFMMKGQSGMAQLGKNKSILQKDDTSITFDDVAGLKEEKMELQEVVEFLKHPERFSNLGARIPKGILLVGPPGTGKTFLSKATAGEAGVPFFTMSGSEFVEMFVGVGASRVRNLFGQAKKTSPCIIFIDEIDAVGRKRGAGLGGGHDEREQTLNQLLVEMDGFAENSGIIILAATNRPDVLDPALLRPGRFDRQIVIGMPDIKDREEIFKIHSRNKPLAEDVDPKILARRTPGFTPADIENMLNESSLLAARKNGTHIHMDEIEEAITKVIAGPEKKSRVMSYEDRKLTAFHEAGHAIIAHHMSNIDPVHQISIVPRGRAGGFTMILPEKDKTYNTRNTMQEQIIHLLGGRAAEEIMFDDISTGASNDIQRATEIARDMVTKYGFSEKLGNINYSSDEEVFLGQDFSSRKNYSEEIASEIDKEIKYLIDSAYEKCLDILKQNKSQLELIANTLLEVETIDGEQFERLLSEESTNKK